MLVDPEAVGFVVSPFAVVDVAIGVDQTPSAVGFTASPVAFVKGAVWPELDSATVALVSGNVPFAFVFGSVFKKLGLPGFSLDAILDFVPVFKFTEFLTDLQS